METFSTKTISGTFQPDDRIVDHWPEFLCQTICWIPGGCPNTITITIFKAIHLCLQIPGKSKVQPTGIFHLCQICVSRSRCQLQPISHSCYKTFANVPYFPHFAVRINHFTFGNVPIYKYKVWSTQIWALMLDTCDSRIISLSKRVSSFEVEKQR